MTDVQVTFLYDLASSLAQLGENQTNSVLRSYYLMRCKSIAGGNGLPDKHFSIKTRCPKCFIEWNKNTQVKVRHLKLTKKQRRRNKSSKDSNEVEQVCTFCFNKVINTVPKPKKNEIGNITVNKIPVQKVVTQENVREIAQKRSNEQNKKSKEAEVNVYNYAIDVYSMNNQNNTLDSTIKEQPKVIKNNKKKKDKFAGLCQTAVLASAKFKQQKDKQNKLNLFLKPSTST